MRKKTYFFSFLVLGSSISTTATSVAQSLQTINLNHIVQDYNGENSFNKRKRGNYNIALTLNIKTKTLKTWENNPNQLEKTVNKFLKDQAVISLFKKVDTENIKEDEWKLIDEISAYIFKNFNQIKTFASNKLYGVSINFRIYYVQDYPHMKVIFNGISFQKDYVSNSQNWVVEKFIPLAPNHLNIYISQNQWQNIILANKDKRKIKTILSTFPQSPSWNKSLISSEYLEIMAEFIIKCSDRINNYMTKNSLSGAIIYSDTKKSWNGIVTQ